ncbi:acyl-CoA/acyl-ACP dehydrogenase [Streptomyces platensis]|uniref:acyl-CoA dehydrogenase family protein n=1 Tax=Streptomyces platensis TaxID=58346 RepID=UPI002E81CD25|nr:acyl-CoA dehydrogenase family protein [Streptomyces platensis]WTI52258.1 acyl-CoA/acyl-ACP dehydrogenase [Streptomyces platensis]WUB82109.1 acyl-CoA/acyl-ACP dehydrogenase [Streptomyces platensis]
MTLPTPLDDLLKLAAETGERLAPLAADTDAGRDNGHESYRILRESGLLALLAPREAGGAGLGFGDYWRVLAELGVHHGAAALGFNMHHVVIGALADAAGTRLPPAAEAFRAWMLDEVVNGRKLFASATSETGRGAKLRGMQTRYRLSDDGTHYLLSGRKSMVSLAGAADYYVVAAAPDGGGEDTGEASHFVVAADDPGVGFGTVPELSAMYGTSTAPMTLDEVPVPRSRLYLGVEGMSLFKVVREPHWMIAGYTGAYLGIAEALFQHTVDHVTASPARADSPVVQQELGRMSARLRAARALVHEAGDLVTAQRGSLEANAMVHAAKYVVGEVGPQLAQDALRLCGSAAISRSHPLERLIREAQFAHVMPAKPQECLEYLGKAAVGVNLYDARAFAW